MCSSFHDSPRARFSISAPVTDPCFPFVDRRSKDEEIKSIFAFMLVVPFSETSVPKLSRISFILDVLDGSSLPASFHKIEEKAQPDYRTWSEGY